MQSTKDNESVASVQEMQASLVRLERREWWRWAVALLIMLLLTIGALSLSLPDIRKNASQEQLDLAVRGLFALVLVFDVFAIYQQVLISRLRRQLSAQIGMVAALEALRPAAPQDPSQWKERRRAKRHRFDQRLKVKATLKGKEAIFFGRIIDISELGLAAVLSGSLERGEKVLLEFSPGEGRPILALLAVIRYANGFRHGFEFASLNAAALDELRRICLAAATAPKPGQA